ncbi:MAG: YqiA/YcfP family alpha/beta fold hydrolase [Myxococcota bacterium]|jgi:hypothetical protein
MKTDVIYLHGFGSDPTSHKAGFIAARLRANGHQVFIPDLNCGDFTSLTATGALKTADDCAASLPGRYVVIGSSFGGYVAALHASRHPESVAGLFMLAPAFKPLALWRHMMTEADFAAWRERGFMDVEHFSWGKTLPLGFTFVTDFERHPEFPDISGLPCTVIHGIKDPVVPVALSREFARLNPQTKLHEMDDVHELMASVPAICDLAAEFVEGCSTC